MNKIFRRSIIHSVCVLLAVLPVLAACKQKKEPEKRRLTPQLLLEMNRKMVSTESEIMDKYIADKELNMQTSTTGFRYAILKSTDGPLIKAGDAVALDYTISLLDGSVCYSSAKNGLMNFVVGKAQVESGLEEAVLMLSKGAKAKLILPPYMAHGVAGDGNKIPKLAIIIMDIEVVEVQYAADVETN